MAINWKIFGQADLLSRLERDLEMDRLSHATLLVGPDKVGKHAVLNKMAQALQCESGHCELCTICQEIEGGRHLDTHVFENDGSSIKIAEMRELKKFVALSKQGRHKLVIIQNIERMTTPAANSFLKMLEEPPVDVMFLLTTADQDSILPTIISRCRLYRARLNSLDSITGFLLENYPGKEESYVDRAALFAAGRVGKAIDLMEDQELFDMYTAWYEELSAFEKQGDAVALIKYAEQIAKLDKSVLKDFFWLFFHYIRYQLHECEDRAKKDQYADIGNLAQRLSNEISRNVSARLALEVLFLRSFANFSKV